MNSYIETPSITTGLKTRMSANVATRKVSNVARRSYGSSLRTVLTQTANAREIPTRRKTSLDMAF